MSQKPWFFGRPVNEVQSLFAKAGELGDDFTFGRIGVVMRDEASVQVTLIPALHKAPTAFWVQLATRDNTRFAIPAPCALEHLQDLLDLWELDGMRWVDGPLPSLGFPDTWTVPVSIITSGKRFWYAAHRGSVKGSTPEVIWGYSGTPWRNRQGGRETLLGIASGNFASAAPMVPTKLEWDVYSPMPPTGWPAIRSITTSYFKKKIIDGLVVPHAKHIGLADGLHKDFEP